MFCMRGVAGSSARQPNQGGRRYPTGTDPKAAGTLRPCMAYIRGPSGLHAWSPALRLRSSRMAYRHGALEASLIMPGQTKRIMCHSASH